MLMSLSNSIIIAWSLSYLGHSFHHPLPWSQCPLLKNISVTGEQRERGRERAGRAEVGWGTMEQETASESQTGGREEGSRHWARRS